MNKYRKFAWGFILAELLCIFLGNFYGLRFYYDQSTREHKVDINRILIRMKEGEAIRDIDLTEYRTVVSVKKYNPEEDCRYDYAVEEVKGVLYRFEYRQEERRQILLIMNLVFFIMLLFSVVLLWYLGKKVIMPFGNIIDLPAELAKGNLSVPVKEEKSRFFGKFLWGMDMLREKLEDDRIRELELIRERKTLILSLSHDIKTPLSAIDLYTRALKSGLYDREEKKQEALEGIGKNTAKIKEYINEITDASKEDFLSLEVRNEEVYLFDVMAGIRNYYEDKMKRNHIKFLIQESENCLVFGDQDRMTEVIQNILENALKYGDGRQVEIGFSEEEDCKLIIVSSTGCGIGEDELPHLFDAFYRGRNSKKAAGSGLGLYICKELMHKMEGEIFVKIPDEMFQVTLVFRKL